MGINVNITPRNLTVLVERNRGKSAYQVAVDNEYTGTATQWLLTLRGIQGIQGNAGTQWYSDTGIPSSDIGIDGDYYIDTDTNNVYQKITDAWVYQFNVAKQVRTVDFQWTELDSSLLAGTSLARWVVGAEFNGWKLQDCHAYVTDPSTSGNIVFQIRRLSEYMLSTPLTIDESDNDSKDSATPAVVDASLSLVTGDAIYVDCIDAGVNTTGAEVSIMIGNY